MAKLEIDGFTIIQDGNSPDALDAMIKRAKSVIKKRQETERQEKVDKALANHQAWANYGRLCHLLLSDVNSDLEPQGAFFPRDFPHCELQPDRRLQVTIETVNGIGTTEESDNKRAIGCFYFPSDYIVDGCLMTISGTMLAVRAVNEFSPAEPVAWWVAVGACNGQAEFVNVSEFVNRQLETRWRSYCRNNVKKVNE